jgi:HlyD family secretion protein
VGNRKIQDINGAKNKVWTVEGNMVVAHRVNIGMTDGTHTQVLSGLKAGQEVITGVDVKSSEESTASADGERSPFAPGPRNRNRK